MKKYLPIFLILLIDYFQFVGFINLSLIRFLSPLIGYYRNISLDMKESLIFFSNIERIRQENSNLRIALLHKEGDEVTKTLESYLKNDLESLKSKFKNDEFFQGKKIIYGEVISYFPDQATLYLKPEEGVVISKGSVVLDGRNLVGTVLDSQNGVAFVELISDKKRDLNTFIITNNLSKIKTVTSGDSFNSLVINNLLATESVSNGDAVVTSTTNEGIPSDLIVGKLENVEQISSQTFRKANVRKLYDLEYVNYLGILQNE